MYAIFLSLIQMHYASEDDPSFLLEGEDLEGDEGVEDDDDEVTGYRMVFLF